MASRERGFELDLESGGNASEEDVSLDLVLSRVPKKKFLGSAFGEFLSSNESIMCKWGTESSSSFVKSGEAMNNSVELLIERNSEGEESQGHVTLAEKMCENERRRKANSKNAPKPPRPPKGPALDAADQKLVREITELAKRKRARIEHKKKAAKKLKASKSSSLQSGISAMVVTLLFFFVIIFQGTSSRSVSDVTIQGSPQPAVATTESSVSFQYYKTDIRSSTNQNFAEDQVSGLGTAKEMSKQISLKAS